MPADGEASGRPPRRWRWGDPVDDLRRLLLADGVVVIPSESSYGLAVDPRRPGAVAAIYDLKNRERGKPLPIVAGDVGQIASLGVADDRRLRRLARLWPAPLTAVLPLIGRVAPAAAAGGATLAVRIPAHRRLRRLLLDLGFPLTATSANRAGSPPILEPDEAATLVAPAHAAVVIDDGILPGGPPSTLVRWPSPEAASAPEILRAGAFPVAKLDMLDLSAVPRPLR